MELPDQGFDYKVKKANEYISEHINPVYSYRIKEVRGLYSEAIIIEISYNNKTIRNYVIFISHIDVSEDSLKDYISDIGLKLLCFLKKDEQENIQDIFSIPQIYFEGMDINIFISEDFILQKEFLLRLDREIYTRHIIEIRQSNIHNIVKLDNYQIKIILKNINFDNIKSPEIINIIEHGIKASFAKNIEKKLNQDLSYYIINIDEKLTERILDRYLKDCFGYTLEDIKRMVTDV